MEGLDLKQMAAMVSVIAEEKGLPEETVMDVIQMAIAAAWRRDNGEKDMNVRAVLNTKTGTADVYVMRTVVEEGVAYDPNTEVPLELAGKGAKVDDIIEEKHEVTTLSHIATQTAKQVITQRLREAERDAVLAEYEDKIGTVVTGTISRVEPRLVRVDLGRAQGIMPRSEQIEGEFYSVGERIKVFIKKVEQDDSRSQLILSRGSADFIEYLFRQEVPEIDSGTVEIKGIAREAGRRSKISVASTVPGVDPVGTFVGGRGVRVQAVMNEIGEREKIDVINWSDNASEYIREALSPAEVMRVDIDGKKAKVYVTEDQQSVAIGRQGQNVRLASKLTGYDIDIIVAKAPEKKKKQNVEDALLDAIEDQEDEEVNEAPVAEPENTETESPAAENNEPENVEETPSAENNESESTTEEKENK